MAQLASYDFRANEDMFANHTELIAWLNGLAKHYTFQKERGDGGYVHWQGRLSLIKKRRPGELITLLTSLAKPIPNYLEPTSNPEFRTGDAFYTQKEDTRIEGLGPIKTNQHTYHARSGNKGLYPWQKLL